MPGLQGGVCAPGLRLVAAGLVAAMFCAAPLPAAGADPYRDVSLALGEGLLALFPAVEGYVVSTSGKEAYVDLAQKDLVKPGMELQVYRAGGDMIHPVTKQVLGSYEKNLGVLSLTEVREKYSRGALDAAGEAAGIAAGDRVRLSARRLRTLLHVAGAAAGIEIGPLAQALIARGEQSLRFAMVDEPGWAPSLAALGAPWETVRADASLLRRLGEAAAADLLLLARIEPGATPRVVVEVRSLRTGTMLGELSERWPASAPAVDPAGAAAPAATSAPAGASAASGPIAAAPAPAPEDYIVRELSTPARALAAGNILGEGRLEVALTDGSRLSLFRWEEKELVWLWDEDGRGGRRVLSLDAADLDGDGRSEVLVTSVVGGRVTSELRRWQDGALKIAATIEGVYLRFAPRPAAPAALLGQRAGFDEVFAGRVERYLLRGESFERIENSVFPRGAGIFGLSLAPEGSAVALYALDRTGYISGMTAEGKVLWRSSRPYGGYPAPLSASELFGRGAFEEEGFDEEMRAFQGRLFAEPTTAGIRLVVPRNFSDSLVTLPRQRAYGQGEVVIFDGPAESPEELRRSRAFDGYVADVARADIDDDASAEVLFVVNRIAGVLQGERGKLVAWRLSGVSNKVK
ncbi:MAG: FG-GAP repeat domain-containing protein [Candidatus Methylomirabilia bacterium]